MYLYHTDFKVSQKNQINGMSCQIGYQQSWFLKGSTEAVGCALFKQAERRKTSSGEVFEWYLTGQWKVTALQKLKACSDTTTLFWCHIIVINVTLFPEHTVSLGESSQISLKMTAWSDAEMLLKWKWSVVLLPWQRRPSSVARRIISILKSFKCLNSLQDYGLITYESGICISGFAGSS